MILSIVVPATQKTGAPSACDGAPVWPDGLDYFCEIGTPALAFCSSAFSALRAPTRICTESMSSWDLKTPLKFLSPVAG